MIRFTCGERKILQNIKKSQNIMTKIASSINNPKKAVYFPYEDEKSNKQVTMISITCFLPQKTLMKIVEGYLFPFYLYLLPQHFKRKE